MCNWGDHVTIDKDNQISKGWCALLVSLAFAGNVVIACLFLGASGGVYEEARA